MGRSEASLSGVSYSPQRLIGDALGGTVLAGESPERLEELRTRFLEALSDLGGGAGEGKPAMVSEVAKRAGLDPEGDPEERALSERLSGELVAAGYASAEAGSSGFLAITPEGKRAVGGGA